MKKSKKEVKIKPFLPTEELSPEENEEIEPK